MNNEQDKNKDFKQWAQSKDERKLIVAKGLADGKTVESIYEEHNWKLADVRL